MTQAATPTTPTLSSLPTEQNEQWHTLWQAWLSMSHTKRRSGSQHTQRSYRQATQRWFAFTRSLGVEPWAATSFQVRQWLTQLQQGDDQHAPLSPAAINQRLAACSSFYSFVLQAHFSEAGRLRTLYEDHQGRALPNPFQAVIVPRQRPALRTTREAKYWHPGESEQLLADLERRRHTLTGSRNYALILGYLLTGYRSLEFVSLRWGSIRPHRQQPGAWVVEWTGKGDKEATDPLPTRVYEAIVAYLERSGRPPATLRPTDYIFIPLITHQIGNLINQQGRRQKTEGRGQKKDDNEPRAERVPTGREAHLSTKQVESIIKGALRRAGLQPRGRVTHGLRHTFAERHYRNKKDLEALRSRLHHGNVATTSLYVATEFPDDPVDDFSEDVYNSLFPPLRSGEGSGVR